MLSAAIVSAAVGLINISSWRRLAAADRVEVAIAATTALEGISHIDTTGIERLAQLVDELRDDGVSLVVARMRTRLKDRLDDTGLDTQIGARHFYPTVRAAVQPCVLEEASQAPASAV